MAKDPLVRPPKHISDKVPRSGGPTPAAAILKALNASSQQLEGYQGWAVDDLEDLWREFQRTAANGKGEVGQIERLFNMAHEIRGQGGTFGFPLISIVGDSLCKFLDRRQELTVLDLDIVRIHIFAMKAVFRQGLKGDRGEIGREVASLFRALRERVGPDRTHDEGAAS
ncbi:MAG: hypothetical protein EXQ86_11590 [Rhodospirillales bacterium]|nr:hypothetical protein [Rhodospirillales bacterium]